MSKQTAKEKVLAAFEQFGWTNLHQHYKLPAEGERPQSSKFRGYNPRTGEKGVVAMESFEADGNYDNRKPIHIEVFFSATGSFEDVIYRASGISFIGTAKTLAQVMDYIEEWSPTRIAARERANANARKAKDAEHEAAVAEAYREVSADLASAELEFMVFLHKVEVQGPSVGVSTFVDEGLERAAKIIALRHEKERVGKGWLPGWSTFYGTYVDGVRVDNKVDA